LRSSKSKGFTIIMESALIIQLTLGLVAIGDFLFNPYSTTKDLFYGIMYLILFLIFLGYMKVIQANNMDQF